MSLYPPAHPSVKAALSRLVETATRVTALREFPITVLPSELLLDNLAPAKVDQAVPELSRILRQHLISGFILHDGGNATTWQTLLSLLGRSPEEIREKGGIGHMWSDEGGLTTEEHRNSIELREIDYERVLLSRALGDSATLKQIFDSFKSGQIDNLDPHAIKTLTEVLHDPAKLELFATELAKSVGPDDGAHAESLFHLLRSAIDLTAGAGGASDDEVLRDLAKMLSGLDAVTMADLLGRRGNPETMADERDVVRAVTEQMASDDVATFISESIAAENGASHRLAEAFQALVPDLEDRRQMVALVGQQMAESPFGQSESFPDVWKQAETLLTSYSDEQYVNDAYAQELNAARRQAMEVEDLNDDPEERIASWLATISNPELRARDVRLLLDLLEVEPDPFRWRDIAGTVCRHIEDLTLSGDLEEALRLLESIAGKRPADDLPVKADSLESFAKGALDQLVAGPAIRQALIRLRTGDEIAVKQVKQLCNTLGPGVVMSLAEALSSERDGRVRTTVRDILVGFGAHGRDAVRQLLHAPKWELRQTAAFLLREFGGSEGLDELRHLLTDSEPLVQREALRAMVNAGDEGAYQLLASVLSEGPTGQRVALLQQLTSQRDVRVVPLCLYLLNHFDHRTLSDVYVAAIETMGAAGGEDVVEPLRDALYRGDWWAPFRTRKHRRTAAQALRRAKVPAARTVLSDAAAHGSWGVRAAARSQLAHSEARS